MSTIHCQLESFHATPGVQPTLRPTQKLEVDSVKKDFPGPTVPSGDNVAVLQCTNSSKEVFFVKIVPEKDVDAIDMITYENDVFSRVRQAQGRGEIPSNLIPAQIGNGRVRWGDREYICLVSSDLSLLGMSQTFRIDYSQLPASFRLDSAENILKVVRGLREQGIYWGDLSGKNVWLNLYSQVGMIDPSLERGTNPFMHPVVDNYVTNLAAVDAYAASMLAFIMINIDPKVTSIENFVKTADYMKAFTNQGRRFPNATDLVHLPVIRRLPGKDEIARAAEKAFRDFSIQQMYNVIQRMRSNT